MRSFVAVCAAIVLSAAVSAQDYTFKKWTPVVGAKTTTTSTNSMKMEMGMEMNGQKMPAQNQEMSDTTKGAMEVLAVEGEEITKIKVSREKTKGAGDESEADPVLNGKTYVLELKDKKITVTDADGKAVDEDMSKKVIDAFAPKGTLDPAAKDPVGKNLAKKTLKIGDTVKVPAKDLMNDGKDSDDKSLDNVFMEFTLKEVKDVDGVKCGLFDIVADLTMSPAPTMAMKMAMKGKCTIGVENLFTYSVEMGGPITGGGDVGEGEQKVKMTIGGEMKVGMKGTLTLPKK